MYKPFVRSALVAMSVSLVLIPESTFACCFCDWFKHKDPVCVAPAPACAVCPQQVSYVPQTCYRTEYTCVPCTSYKPVATCDPCGGASTVMQPVTTYVRRAVQVPYTSYRPVATTLNYAPAAPCATCGTANYYSPAPVAAPAAVMPTSGCSTCGANAAVGYAPAATSYVTPAASYTTPAPSYSSTPSYTPAPMTMPSTMPPTGTPTLAPSQSIQAPSTFQPNNNPAPQDNSSLRPIQPIQPNEAPSNDPKINSSSAPLLQDPQNRTTGLMGPAYVTTAIFRIMDRPNVFKPAVMEGDWSAAPKSDEGWSAAGSR